MPKKKIESKKLVDAHTPDRPVRVPLHEAARQSMIVRSCRPGMHPCLVTDRIASNGALEIDNYLRAGYTFMRSTGDIATNSRVFAGCKEHYKGDGDYIRQVVNPSDGTTGIYMEIPQELWEEDQRAMVRRNLQHERDTSDPENDSILRGSTKDYGFERHRARALEPG